MKTVYPYLIFGALIGAVIHGAVPTEWITNYLGGDNWWLVPIARYYWYPIIYSSFYDDSNLANHDCKRNGIRSSYGIND